MHDTETEDRIHHAATEICLENRLTGDSLAQALANLRRHGQRILADAPDCRDSQLRNEFRRLIRSGASHNPSLENTLLLEIVMDDADQLIEGVVQIDGVALAINDEAIAEVRAQVEQCVEQQIREGRWLRERGEWRPRLQWLCRSAVLRIKGDVEAEIARHRAWWQWHSE